MKHWVFCFSNGLFRRATPFGSQVEARVYAQGYYDGVFDESKAETLPRQEDGGFRMRTVAFVVPGDETEMNRKISVEQVQAALEGMKL